VSGLVLPRIVDFVPAAPLIPIEWSRVAATLLLAVAGVAVIRLTWIAVGLTRLRVIRQRSEPLLPLPSFVADLSSRLQTSAAIHVSDDVACPVTLGFRVPLILLPKRALDHPAAVQRAIICHELLHVRRRDWLRTLLEQMWSALLWFHPAAHVLLSRIGLMREAVVDEETIRITADRRAYAQALLAFAEPALTPLPVMHLIRPRHLPRRIALIAQEVRMSRRHSITALAAALFLVALATGATARRLPLEFPFALAALPSTPTVQEAFKPGNGVTLPRVTKQVRPQYTAAAMKQKIQGSVQIEMVVSTDGEPTDLKVARSLDAEYGLDEAALRAAAEWRFEPGRKDGKPVPVIITLELTFTLK
jgi:TonB family protein